MKPARFGATLLAAILTIATVSCAMETATLSGHGRAEITVAEVEASEPFLYTILLNHPHTFEIEAIERLIRSLYFSSKSVISWAEKRPVFSDPEVQEIVPLIRESFLLVKPYQKIRFEVHAPNGPTTGDLFILDSELHWRFAAIQGTAHFEEFESPFQFESETSVIPNWILRPQDHQHYYNPEWVLGIKREAKNWLVLAMEKHEEPAEARPKHSEERESPTERLRLLQELKAAKLITEGDYEKKVRALLADATREEIPVSERLLFLKQLREEGMISNPEYERRKQQVLDRI